MVAVALWVLVHVVEHRRYFRFFGARWLSALPAAVFEAFDVRPSRSTFDAARAALAPVLRVAITNTPHPKAVTVTASSVVTFAPEKYTVKVVSFGFDRTADDIHVDSTRQF